MDALSGAYVAIADLNLWIKVTASSPLSLADLPKIIRYRYQYILDNWIFIKDTISGRITDYDNPDRANIELAKFDLLVQIESTQSSKNKTNETTLMSTYYTVFDILLISDIPVTKQEQDIIDQEIERVRKFTKTDFLNLRSTIVLGRDAIADTMGGTDEDYNRVYNRSPLETLLNRNINSIYMASTLQDSIGLLDLIIVNSQAIYDRATIDPFAIARANANNPDFDIQTYSSGRLVRLNYEETLQSLAIRTLGSESRWIEIAIANGLKPPYIDEVGELIPLIANGNNNQINIAATNISGTFNREKIYINQVILIQSNVERIAEQYTIRAIREIPVSGELIIDLADVDNLDRYLVVDDASIRVYQPQTINSNSYILIPSNEATPPKSSQDTPWFLQSKGEDERRMGIDLSLDDVGDLRFLSSGDVGLCYGIENATQAVRIKMETLTSSLPLHLDFGLSSGIGTLSGDAAKQAIIQSINQQILADIRFDRLDYLTVQSVSGGYLVSLGVILTGGTTVIPISFSVSKV
jgi:hypothetical protein